MDRRGFIQSVLGAAAMTVVPGSGDGVALKSIAHPRMQGKSVGFGLAQVKMEGASIPYDPGLRAEFPKALLKDGLSKVFGDVYDDLKPESFEELWVEIDDERTGTKGIEDNDKKNKHLLHGLPLID